MTKAIIAGLLLVATSAHADHVWRLWCGHPPTDRGASDTSAECNHDTAEISNMVAACADTPEGPRFDGMYLPANKDRTCAEVRQRFAGCHCELEDRPVATNHVWRLWCERPSGQLTPREEMFDTARDCDERVNATTVAMEAYCRDTPQGAGLPGGSPDPNHTCKEVIAVWKTCTCRPEKVGHPPAGWR
jgi:hypothetical protein